MRILNLPLELANLTASKRYGYSMGIGLDDAFRSAGFDVITIPAVSRWPPDQRPGFWLARIRDILGNQTFDQVWIEVQYCNFDTDFLDYLTTIAPVRVGLMTESRTLLPGEYGNFFDDLPKVFSKRLPYLTHILLPDEKDVASLADVPHLRAVFMPLFVNEQFIERDPPDPVHDKAIFLGRLLRDRKALLEHPAVAGMVEAIEDSGEDKDSRLTHFDAICRFYAAISEMPLDSTFSHDLLAAGVASHVEVLRGLKARAHETMARTIQRGIANINLRSYSVLFSSRVPETMAVGQCVISYRLEDRPRTNGLFEHGKEILLFDDSNAESLAEQINLLRRDPALRRTIVRNSQAKLVAYHTTERRIHQLLQWIEQGNEPIYA